VRIEETPKELKRGIRKVLVMSKSGTNLKEYLEAAR
jgi:hypothetical protein